MRIITINTKSKTDPAEYEFMFVCTSRNTSHGFAHDCTLFINGNEKNTAHCYYLNRTWERYTYQSVCIEAITDFIDYITDRKKEVFKKAHKYKKMTEKRQKEFNEYISHYEYINQLKDCKDQLNTNLY